MVETSPLDRCAPFPVLLAPMVGLTHFVVRRAIREFLPAGSSSLWPTEMLSSRRIPAERQGQSIETRFDDHADGLCPQLLANEEGFIRDSIVKLKDWGARAIDINMGCPVKRALKHNYGVALMGDPDYAAEVTAFAVKYAGDLPVSVKLRAAPPPNEAQDQAGPDPEYLKNFCLKLQSAGASWITLHPRTAVQKRRGEADWAQIAEVKSWLRIPVIGNGDIETASDIREMFEETGCDRVMVGRALLAKPWLLRAALDPREEISDPLRAGETYGRFVSRVLELTREHYPESLGVRKFKFFILYGSPYLEYGHTLQSWLSSASSFDELGRAITKFFGERYERAQKMNMTTVWRG